jgi:hypothetical protein
MKANYFSTLGLALLALAPVARTEAAQLAAHVALQTIREQLARLEAGAAGGPIQARGR